ncbi:hypothetical protein ACAG25_13440 [Mycobacterium sp. pV006]|uniref:hypothetical protein n=1 Tax=Mycobacterium sp. pV006 TaxID=3238983 RepID=UPI00351BCBCB
MSDQTPVQVAWVTRESHATLTALPGAKPRMPGPQAAPQVSPIGAFFDHVKQEQK